MPTQDVITRLKKTSKHVGLTAKVTYGDINKYYRRDAVGAIKSATRSAKLVDIPDKIGLIRARLHLDGEVTQLINIPPATWL